MESNGYINDEQNGFREGRGCLEHIFTLSSFLRNRRDQGKSTYCAFVDMSFAFDNVNFQCLFYKMLKYGISGRIYSLIQKLYESGSSCVLVNGNPTDWFPIEKGVRQGDTVSAALFNLYVNDLVDALNSLNKGILIDEKSVSVLLYADDIVLVSDSENGLQCLLDALRDWCSKWRFKVNYTKTKIVHFRKQHVPRTTFAYCIGIFELDVVTSYTYLGYLFHEYVDMSYGVSILCEAAGRALGSLVAKHISIGLPFSVYTKLYDSLVVPVMDYSCEVWGFKDYSKCQALQHRAQRTYLGVGKFCPVPYIEGETGWTPVIIRHHVAMVRLWLKLVKLPEDRLTKFVFNWDHEMALSGSKCWSSEVKGILEQCDLGIMWSTKTPVGIPEKEILKVVHNRLLNTYQSKWLNQINSMPKLRTYKYLKFEFETASFLQKPVSFKARSNIARLRSGTFPITVETGRYRGIPLESRLCPVCKNGVETEEHFLTVCPAYTNERKQLYSKIHDPLFPALSNFDKTVYLLTVDSLIFTVAKAVELFFHIRSDLINQNM